MNDRVKIIAAESLSRRWARLDAYTIAYTRRDGLTETLIREVHDHGHGACVLPYDAARRTVLLVKQFRLPALLNGLDSDMIEVCAGRSTATIQPNAPGARPGRNWASGFRTCARWSRS